MACAASAQRLLALAVLWSGVWRSRGEGHFCLEVLLFDTYGDGWNRGAELLVQHAEVGEIYGPITLHGGRFADLTLCLPADGGDYLFYANKGEFDSEDKWVVTYRSQVLLAGSVPISKENAQVLSTAELSSLDEELPDEPSHEQCLRLVAAKLDEFSWTGSGGGGSDDGGDGYDYGDGGNDAGGDSSGADDANSDGTAGDDTGDSDDASDDNAISVMLPDATGPLHFGIERNVSNAGIGIGLHWVCLGSTPAGNVRISSQPSVGQAQWYLLRPAEELDAGDPNPLFNGLLLYADAGATQSFQSQEILDANPFSYPTEATKAPTAALTYMPVPEPHEGSLPPTVEQGFPRSSAVCFQFVLTDRVGDGWEGGYLTVRSTTDQRTLASFTLPNGGFVAYELCLPEGDDEYEIIGTEGNFASEAHWAVFHNDAVLFSAGIGDGWGPVEYEDDQPVVRTLTPGSHGAEDDELGEACYRLAMVSTYDDQSPGRFTVTLKPIYAQETQPTLGPYTFEDTRLALHTFCLPEFSGLPGGANPYDVVAEVDPVCEFGCTWWVLDKDSFVVLSGGAPTRQGEAHVINGEDEVVPVSAPTTRWATLFPTPEVPVVQSPSRQPTVATMSTPEPTRAPSPYPTEQATGSPFASPSQAPSAQPKPGHSKHKGSGGAPVLGYTLLTFTCIFVVLGLLLWLNKRQSFTEYTRLQSQQAMSASQFHWIASAAKGAQDSNEVEIELR